MNGVAPARDSPPQADPGASIEIMIDWSTCHAVERDIERAGGAWVFRGTRVPVAALFENLEDGVAVGHFVELFPGSRSNRLVPYLNTLPAALLPPLE